MNIKRYINQLNFSNATKSIIEKLFTNYNNKLNTIETKINNQPTSPTVNNTYYLGNFDSSNTAYKEAAKVGIVDDPLKCILVATINNSKGIANNIIIVNNVYKNENKTVQTMFTQRDSYIRTVDLGTVNGDYYSYPTWWSSHPYNIKANVVDNNLKLQLTSWLGKNIGTPTVISLDDLNNKSTIPFASNDSDGLITKDDYKLIKNELILNNDDFENGHYYLNYVNGVTATTIFNILSITQITIKFGNGTSLTHNRMSSGAIPLVKYFTNFSHTVSGVCFIAADNENNLSILELTSDVGGTIYHNIVKL